MFEELVAKDAPRARAVLAECRRVVPHGTFTFTKVWMHAAHLEVRQLALVTARKLLGNALGYCPKEKLFKQYIMLELQLGEVPRCRALYQSFLQWAPENCTAWVAFAELEASLGELERCRAIYGLAIDQQSLDMPETLWKSYIDFELGNGEEARTRDLYRQLLERTTHVKVWISFARFEAQTEGADAAAGVYKEAEEFFKDTALKEERSLVLEAWREMESATADEARLELVDLRMPRRVKKKRPVAGCDGEEVGWEEYFDYIYPEEEAKVPSLKILEMAHKWKRQKLEPQQQEADEGCADV